MGENGCVLMELQFEGGGAAVQEDGGSRKRRLLVHQQFCVLGD